MAIQGKGILGVPTGVIGYLNCYNRLGKGIIQSRGTVEDKYLRRWNLLEWQLTQRLEYMWNYFTASQQTDYTLAALNGRTGLESFVHLSLQYTFQNRLTTLTNCNFGRYQTESNFPAFAVGKWSHRKITFNIPPDNPIWGMSATIRIRVSFYSETLAKKTINYNFDGSNVVPLIIYFDGSINDLYNFTTYRIQRLTPNKVYGDYIADVFNPTYL